MAQPQPPAYAPATFLGAILLLRRSTRISLKQLHGIQM